MNLTDALSKSQPDTSGRKAARNDTGRVPVLVVAAGDGGAPDGSYAVIGTGGAGTRLQRRGINFPTEVGVNPDAWEPIYGWPGGTPPETR
jgi:hypothetical protein